MPNCTKLSKSRHGITFCLTLAVCATPALSQERGGFSPERIIESRDTNRNGRLDPEELEQLPSFFRDALQRSGVDMRRGVDARQLQQAMDQMRQNMQSQGGFGRGGDSSGGYRGGYDRGGSSSGGSDRGNSDRSSSDRGSYDRGSYDRGGSDRGGYDRGGYDRGGSDRGGYDRGGYDRSGSDRGSDERRRDESRSGDPRTANAAAAPLIKPKDRVTVDLPSSFAEGDLDGDGQIAFYEWRQWKRGTLDEFAAYDHDGDGFLTPRELTLGPRSTPGATSGPLLATTNSAAPPAAASTSVAGASTVRRDSGSGRRDSGNPGSRVLMAVQAPSGTTSSSEAGGGSTRAASMFRLLDGNKDGQISPEEWAQSTKLKPQFVEGGVDLSRPLSREEFVSHYDRLVKP